MKHLIQYNKFLNESIKTEDNDIIHLYQFSINELGINDINFYYNKKDISEDLKINLSKKFYDYNKELIKLLDKFLNTEHFKKPLSKFVGTKNFKQFDENNVYNYFNALNPVKKNNKASHLIIGWTLHHIIHELLEKNVTNFFDIGQDEKNNTFSSIDKYSMNQKIEELYVVALTTPFKINLEDKKHNINLEDKPWIRQIFSFINKNDNNYSNIYKNTLKYFNEESDLNPKYSQIFLSCVMKAKDKDKEIFIKKFLNYFIEYFENDKHTPLKIESEKIIRKYVSEALKIREKYFPPLKGFKQINKHIPNNSNHLFHF